MDIDVNEEDEEEKINLPEDIKSIEKISPESPTFL